MAFIVETGSGTPGANAYAAVAFVTAYLTDRGRETENSWSTSTTAEQQESIVEATDYIEKRWGLRFKGQKAQSLIDGRTASGTLTFSGLPLDTETVVVGLKTYRFAASLEEENDVLIGADIAACVANLVEAINSGGGDGSVVHVNTLPNYEALAVDSSPDLAVYARTKGENGNLIAFSETITNASITGSGFLTDGLDEAEQPLAFPRRGLYTRDGREVIGIPLKLKQATAEYAVRALASATVLAPDPAVDTTLVPVVRARDKVGALETEREYATGGIPKLTKPYPAADMLLSEYVTAPMGAFR